MCHVTGRRYLLKVRSAAPTAWAGAVAFSPLSPALLLARLHGTLGAPALPLPLVAREMPYGADSRGLCVQRRRPRGICVRVLAGALAFAFANGAV